MSYRTSQPLHPTEDDKPKKKGMTGMTGPTGYSMEQYKTDSVNLDKAVKGFTKYHSTPRKKSTPGNISIGDLVQVRKDRKTIVDLSNKKAFTDLTNKRHQKK